MFFLRVAEVPLKGIRLLKSRSYLIQTATITSRTTRGDALKLKDPFPYDEKKFAWYHDLFFDPTINRLSDENAKVIVVEGSIGAGKSAFCEALADEFEMKYFPQPTMDALYKLPSGYDLRKHDDEVPKEVRSYDHKNFCVDPFTFQAALFQYKMFCLKFHQYIDALCHLLNTGQGVILERSYFSDYVFMKAMTENKFVSRDYEREYLKVCDNADLIFPAPHLIIYLDMPVPVVQERIKTRNFSYEQNSPALTPQYLASLEKFMKKDYLKVARKNSEILIYDWSDGGNVDVVIDDIENIDFDIMRADKRFKQWMIARKDLRTLRHDVTNRANVFNKYLWYPWYKFDEVYDVAMKNMKWHEIMAQIPECKYDIGYNYETGDSIFKILFNTSAEKHRVRRYFLPSEYDPSRPD